MIMKVIVWLWNPWKQYENTRHNIWFQSLDKWLDTIGENTNDFEKKYKGNYKKIHYHDQDICIIKPQTFMNLSWESVSLLTNFYKVPPKDILVLHDEIDFPTAKIMLKFWWSPAWHNGLKSIIEKLWTRDFRRIRIGIDRPSKKEDVTNRVLWKFTKSEKELLKEKEFDIYSSIDMFIDQKD
jgi:PTH1 family peptidyl-tRNA hydrolase